METMRNYLVAAVLLLISGTASASSAVIQQGPYKMGKAPPLGDRLPVVGPVFKVYSEEKEGYSFVGDTHHNLDFVVSATALCSSPRRVGEITADVYGSTDSKYKRTKLGRGAVVGGQFKLSVPQSKLKGFNPVKACNDGLRTLAAETGDSKRELVAKGFSLRVEDVYQGSATASCSGGVARGHFRTDEAPLDAWVDCRPNPDALKEEPRPQSPPRKATSPARQVPPPARQVPPPARQAPAPARLSSLVSSVEFEVSPRSGAIVCPAELQFTGSITAGRPGTVRYQIAADDGSKSAIHTLNFSAAGTQAIAPMVQGVGQGVRPVAEDEEGVSRRLRGWRRLEIVEPAGLRYRGRADYRLLCVEGAEDLEELPQ